MRLRTMILAAVLTAIPLSRFLHGRVRLASGDDLIGATWHLF
jgi:hypothetical protein